MVSAGNFLTALVLARSLAPASYGTFSLFFLALFAINTCHSSLVVYPLTLRGAGSTAEDLGELTGLALLHTLILSVPFGMCIGIFALALHRTDLLLPLACAMLFWQLQETTRRALLSALRARDAILPDALCYIGQGLILLLLHAQSLTEIFYLIAVTSLLATIWQMLIVRAHLRGNLRSRSVEYGRYAWQMGRYILAGNALNMFSLQVPSWALAFAFGPLDVAGYQSLLNLVGVANPIIFSANNLLIPAIVRAAPQGIAPARRTALRYGARYGLLLVPCFLALLLAPHFIMHLAYGTHTSYARLAPLLRPFVLAFAVQYLATVIGAYEGGMSRPQTYMWVQIVSVVALLCIGVPLILRWGVTGAVYAMLAASAVRLCAFALISWSSDKLSLATASADRKTRSNSPPQETSPLVSSSLEVRVCVLTYRRPDLLRRTLDSLVKQTAVGSNSIGMTLLVIDNDDSSSARKVVDDARDRCPVRLDYLANPRNGLSTGRNLGLDHSATADFVAFIDDDETAEPEWLEQLIATAVEFSADVVTGPVLPHHQHSSSWVVRGGFFAPAIRQTGEAVPHVATNNTLLHANVARTLRFDPHFDSSGGEDTDFFLRAVHAKCKIIWCAEAKVLESVPEERANLRWILRRAYSDANRFTSSSIRLHPSPRTTLERVAKGTGGIAAGIALLPVGIVGRHFSARGLQLIARGAGTFSGLRGRSSTYYGAASKSAKAPRHPTSTPSPRKQSRLTVAVVGQVPPPMNGQALMIREFLQGDYSGLRLIHIPMNFSRSTEEVGRVGWRKIWILARTLFGIVKARFRNGATVLYYPPAGANVVPVLRDLVLLALCRPLYPRTVFHFHAAGLSNVYAKLPFWLKPAYSCAYKRPDLAIFTTKATSSDAKHLRARRVAIVACGAPDDAHPQTVQTSKNPTAANLHKSSPKILFAGILCEGKGVMILLEACRLLRGLGIAFNLQLLGEFQSTEFESVVRSFILESDLTDVVDLPGMVLGEAKAFAFRSASIFCFPSHYAAESFGVVLIEAMSFSLPIVATDWQGIPEVTGTDGKGTFLVPARHAEALASSLAQLLLDGGLRSSMGQHNRLRYLQRFTLSRYREALASCLLAIE